MNSEKNEKLLKQIKIALRDPDMTNMLIDKTCARTKDSQDFLMILCQEISKVDNSSTREMATGILVNRAKQNPILKENMVALSENPTTNDAIKALLEEADALSEKNDFKR